MSDQEVFERPSTRRGNRTQSLVLNEPEPQSYVVERPGTRRGRRISVPSTTSDSPSPHFEEISPDVTPRPPTSARPPVRYRSNVRTQSQDSGIYDKEGSFVFQSGSFSGSRPSTASSLNRYTPLPSIGTRLDLYEPSNSGDTDGKVLHTAGEPKMSKKTNLQVTDENKTESRVNTKTESNVVKSSNKQASNKNSSLLKKTPEGSSMKETPDGHDSTKDGANNNKKESEDYYPNLFKPLKRRIRVIPVPAENEPCLTLAVKLPTGQRIQRAFAPSNTLKDVMDYAEHAAKLDFQKCNLACSVPVKIFKNLKATLMESGIENRTIFHIHLPG